MMTFEQFQATGRDVADVSRQAQLDEPKPGRVYADGQLFMELEPDGQLMLTIGNAGWIRPRSELALLEAELYEFAAGEGYLD